MPWPPPPALRKLARRLLALEAASGKARGQLGAAAFGVSERLRQPLSTLAGAAGFRSLLSRALALASDEVRWLKAVHIDADGSLGSDAGRLSDDEIADGEAALVAQLIGLLVTFIGEALTLRLLQETWPKLSFARPNFEPEQDDHG